MKIKLTKKSSDEIMGWHASRGIVFLSEGTGNSFKYFNVGFIQNENGYFLDMGHSKPIKLTEEQISKIGSYSVPDFEEE